MAHDFIWLTLIKWYSYISAGPCLLCLRALKLRFCARVAPKGIANSVFQCWAKQVFPSQTHTIGQTVKKKKTQINWYVLFF